jgi:hypothetical protein
VPVTYDFILKVYDILKMCEAGAADAVHATWFDDRMVWIVLENIISKLVHGCTIQPAR